MSGLTPSQLVKLSLISLSPASTLESTPLTPGFPLSPFSKHWLSLQLGWVLGLLALSLQKVTAVGTRRHTKQSPFGLARSGLLRDADLAS